MQGGSQHEEQPTGQEIPEHLKRWPGLYLREGERVVEAPAEDIAVARAYPQWPDKGEIVDGARITIMTRSNTYHVGEEIRVIHVAEVIEPGREVYVMGPKLIYGEYVDGQLVTEPPPAGTDPLVPLIYDGPTLASPAIDYNYDIKTYTYQLPGSHAIYWQLGSLRSNVLQIQIVESKSP